MGTDSANRLGQYAAARSAALMIAVVVVAILHTRWALVPVAAAMVAVQALDAIIGVGTRKLEKVAGPAVLALVNLTALLLLWKAISGPHETVDDLPMPAPHSPGVVQASAQQANADAENRRPHRARRRRGRRCKQRRTRR